MDDIAIVPATPQMAAQIADILVDTGWFPAIHRTRVEEVLAHGARGMSRLLVAQDKDGDIVGYVAYHLIPALFLPADEGYVSELFVRAGQRGRGIGAALLDAAVHDAEASGVARMMLLTGRNRDSYRRGFYRKNGWCEREQISNFILPRQSV